MEKVVKIGTFTGLLLPIGLAILGGFENSISLYLYTNIYTRIYLETSLAVVSLGFIFNGKNRFTLSGVLLLLVAFIGCKEYPYIHSISAIAFFIVTAVRITKDKRFGVIGYIMFSVAPLGLFSIYWAEVILLELIVLFNLLYIFKTNKLNK